MNHVPRQCQEHSQSEVLEQHDVEVIELRARHTHSGEGTLVLERNGALLSPEQFVQAHLQEEGFDSIFTESIPFHVLFAVFMWILVQDPDDERLDVRGFGRRDQVDQAESEVIWTRLPADFGSPGYSSRRESAIQSHLSDLPTDRNELAAIFDYWLPDSHDLRQYLWAHEQTHIDTARQLIEIISPSHLITILEYLVGDYWHRYVGWPDLVAYNNVGYMFVEVKSSGDRLSEDQKRWICDNSEILGLPFKLVKIHRDPA